MMRTLGPFANAEEHLALHDEVGEIEEEEARHDGPHGVVRTTRWNGRAPRTPTPAATNPAMATVQSVCMAPRPKAVLSIAPAPRAGRTACARPWRTNAEPAARRTVARAARPSGAPGAYRRAASGSFATSSLVRDRDRMRREEHRSCHGASRRAKDVRRTGSARFPAPAQSLGRQDASRTIRRSPIVAQRCRLPWEEHGVFTPEASGGNLFAQPRLRARLGMLG